MDESEHDDRKLPGMETLLSSEVKWVKMSDILSRGPWKKKKKQQQSLGRTGVRCQCENIICRIHPSMVLHTYLHARQNVRGVGSKAASTNDEEEDQDDSRDSGSVDHPSWNDLGRRVIATCSVPQHPVEILGKYEAVQRFGT